jgi:hypothetical protein
MAPSSALLEWLRLDGMQSCEEILQIKLPLCKRPGKLTIGKNQLACSLGDESIIIQFEVIKVFKESQYFDDLNRGVSLVVADNTLCKETAGAFYKFCGHLFGTLSSKTFCNKN